MAKDQSMRFEFGQNWHKFVKKNFSEERLEVAKKKMLEFTGRTDFEGLDFLDIGCGSGIHSYAAMRAGARKVHSFDYDGNSVLATKALREHAGAPQHWNVEQGDVLDKARIAELGKWNFVYSWGVLHHTGEMWQAIRNAQETVAEGGLFYIALYSKDADFQPSQEFWLEVKQEYNRAGWLKKQWMVLWYIWRFSMQKELRRLPEVLKTIFSYRLNRGMNFFADIRDWIGGWPMEYAGDQETVDLLEQEYGFKLVNVSTGHACSEFLFERSGSPEEKSIVEGFVSRL